MIDLKPVAMAFSIILIVGSLGMFLATLADAGDTKDNLNNLRDTFAQELPNATYDQSYGTKPSKSNLISVKGHVSKSYILITATNQSGNQSDAPKFNNGNVIVYSNGKTNTVYSSNNAVAEAVNEQNARLITNKIAQIFSIIIAILGILAFITMIIL